MKIKILILIILFAPMFNSCTKEVNCYDLQIQPAFIDFPLPDIDTLVIRKFKPNENYQNLVDTFVVTYNDYYRTSNDTTKILSFQHNGFMPGFDWQVFIPALNRTVFVSDILSNKKTSKCGTRAVGDMCSCYNDLFSAKKDNQIINFSNTDIPLPYIYIRK